MDSAKLPNSEARIPDEALAQIAELGYAVVETSLKCIGHSEQSLARQEHEECKAQLREAVETVSGVKQSEGAVPMDLEDRVADYLLSVNRDDIRIGNAAATVIKMVTEALKHG